MIGVTGDLNGTYDMRIPPSLQRSRPLKKGRAKGRGLQCPAGAQFTVAVSRAHASTVLPSISYHSLTVLQNSASSRQSIPAFGRPLLQGGTRLKLFSILRGASDFYAPHHHFAFLISNFSFKRSFHPQSVDDPPHGLTLNPEPRTLLPISQI